MTKLIETVLSRILFCAAARLVRSRAKMASPRPYLRGEEQWQEKSSESLRSQSYSLWVLFGSIVQYGMV